MEHQGTPPGDARPPDRGRAPNRRRNAQRITLIPALLALLFAIPATAFAQDCVTELRVIHGGTSGFPAPAGFTKIGVDLNQGAGGEYVYLCIKRGVGAPITGVTVEVGGGWGSFSASVSASYEQTSTAGEVNSVSFSEENTTTETYSVGPDPDHTMVYGLWQLVDRFAMVDADSVRIEESDTMRHARLAAITDIEFPSSTVIRQSVTRF